MISKIINFITVISCFISFAMLVISTGFFVELPGELTVVFVVYSTLSWIISLALIVIFIIKEIVLNHRTVNGVRRSQSPIAKPVLIAVIIFLVGLFVLFIVDRYYLANREIPSYTFEVNQEESVLQNLLLTWKTTQSSFGVRASESGTYNLPNNVQFISTNTMLVHYDDGLVDHISVVKFEHGSFKELVNVGVMSTMPVNSWQQLVRQYGNENYTPVNYSISGPDKKMQLVDQNLFVR